MPFKSITGFLWFTAAVAASLFALNAADGFAGGRIRGVGAR